MGSKLEPLLQRAAWLNGAALANIQYMDWRSRTLYLLTHHGFPSPVAEAFREVRFTDGTACARAALSRKPVFISDVLTDPDFAPFRALAARAGFRSVMSVPLLTPLGALTGILSVHGQYARQPPTWQLARTKSIADRVAVLLLREAARPGGAL